uniref:PABS domain-containing protein n=1 Tax=Meloidogyne enterolobii TaxID=390850 RepID=A0A6V7TSJ2_MELEN|nr:unnamed protein product [Meloidogyne enterolobii]
MDSLHKGWFTEFSPDDADRIAGSDGGTKMMHLDGQEMSGAWTGQAFSLDIDKVLFHQKSKYQDVLVLKSKTFGNVLVLDGVIQTTDRDEFAYQEMLAHLPMFSHPNPKNVLIIGGGDGGILREVLKHASVEHVVMCEIDEMVVNVAKEYLHGLSSSFNSPKLELHIGDGPAESLFGSAYYELVFDALRDDGVLSSQAESIWLHLPLITKLVECVQKIFPSVAYASSSVPTYPSGCIGYLIAGKQKKDLRIPQRSLNNEQCKAMGLQFYNSQMHSASFVLPNFAASVLPPTKMLSTSLAYFTKLH